MKTIKLSLQQYNGTQRIVAEFGYSVPLVNFVKEVPGARYDTTRKCWHMPAVKELVLQLAEKVRGTAVIDASVLKVQLEQMRQPADRVKQHIQMAYMNSLPGYNRDALKRFVETLFLKQYSQSTIKTYRNEFSQLLKEIKEVPVNNLNIGHIRRYMRYCLEHYKISEATANSRIKVYPVGF